MTYGKIQYAAWCLVPMLSSRFFYHTSTRPMCSLITYFCLLV